MNQREEGWPLGLRPLNDRVGLVRSNRDFSGSISFTTLFTRSSTSLTDFSSDPDTEPTGSFFNEKNITLGSAPNILSLSRRLIITRRTGGEKFNYKSKPWFSLCSRLTTDAVDVNNNAAMPPSLGHFLQEERKARKSDRSPTNYGIGNFPSLQHSSSLSALFLSEQVHDKMFTNAVKLGNIKSQELVGLGY